LSLALIKQYAQDVKNRRYDFIDYNIEPGTLHPKDPQNPVASIVAAADATHRIGLKFKVSPAFDWLEQYSTSSSSSHMIPCTYRCRGSRITQLNLSSTQRTGLTKLLVENSNLQYISIQVSGLSIKGRD
jgi:hypothetical protein